MYIIYIYIYVGLVLHTCRLVGEYLYMCGCIYVVLFVLYICICGCVLHFLVARRAPCTRRLPPHHPPQKPTNKHQQKNKQAASDAPTDSYGGGSSMMSVDGDAPNAVAVAPAGGAATAGGCPTNVRSIAGWV